MKTSNRRLRLFLPLLIVTAVQKTMAVTPTFLQTTTGIGTAVPTHTAKVDVLTYTPTSPENKETTGIKYETTNTPSTTSNTAIPTTTTFPAIETSSIVQKTMAVTPTFLQTTTGIGTAVPTHTAKVDVLTYTPTSPENKETTGTKYETTNIPSTTSNTAIPTTTTFPAIKTSSIESCEHIIPDYLKEFYTLVFISSVPRCVSHCDILSPYYFNCNGGACDILPSVGPQCFCPETDLYIYADDRCGGKISKLSLFIGVGVALAVLVVVTIILGIYLHRKKHRTAPRKDSLYQSIE